MVKGLIQTPEIYIDLSRVAVSENFFTTPTPTPTPPFEILEI